MANTHCVGAQNVFVVHAKNYSHDVISVAGPIVQETM